jgi:hypothetical protein
LGLVVCNSSSIRQGERRSRRAKRENGADADLLAHRFALKRRANGFGRTNKIFIGDVQRRTRTSVPRVNELNGTHRGGQRDGRQLEQARGFLDLGFFQPQSIRFIDRKTCSILHRSRERRTMSVAAANSSTAPPTGNVVSSCHEIGASPLCGRRRDRPSILQ